MFIVVEPCISGDKADKVIRKLRFSHSYKVDARGFEGGISLLNEDLGSAQGFEKSSKFISYIINLNSSHPGGALTAVYVSPIPTTRELLWNDLTQFDEFYGIPWMLVGDSQIIYSYDKQGGGALNIRGRDQFLSESPKVD